MRINRSKLAVGCLSAGLALSLASAAFACVPFRGDLTVTAPGANGNKVTGDNTSTSHGYCTGATPTSAAAAGFSNSVTVTVANGSSCNSLGTNHLVNGTANNSVYLNNASTDATVPFKYNTTTLTWEFQNGTGCWASPTPTNRVSFGTITIASGGGSLSHTLAHTDLHRVDPTNMASEICVGDGTVGIIAPIRITSI